MATTDLTVTGFDANTGWVGTATDMAASNDTRVTDGVVGDTFDAALTNPGGTYGTTNSVQLVVEARTAGTIVRTKQLQLDLKNSVGTIISTFTTGDIAATDTVYSGTVDTTTPPAGDDETAVNGWYITATVTEGGGMPDTATVEIDHLYVTADFEAPAQTVTDSFLDDSTDGFFAETVSPGAVTVTDSFLDDSTDGFFAETTALNIAESYLDDSADTFYSEALALNILDSYYDDSADTGYPETVSPGAVTVTDSFLDDSTDGFFAETVSSGGVTVTDSFLDDSTDTFYSEELTGLNEIIDSYLDDSADTFFGETVTLVETTRRYIIS